MSLSLYAKALQTITTASNTATAAVDKYGERKAKYGAYLDALAGVVSVVGTGSGYIKTLKTYIDNMNAAFAKGDYASGFAWQLKLAPLAEVVRTWMGQLGYKFNLMDFENYLKMGGQLPGDVTVNVTGSPNLPQGFTDPFANLKSTGLVP